jgi:flavin-dependent dehydrogenase
MAALVLAQLGQRVLLVDSSARRRKKIGEVLPPDAAAQLRAVGAEAPVGSMQAPSGRRQSVFLGPARVFRSRPLVRPSWKRLAP